MKLIHLFLLLLTAALHAAPPVVTPKSEALAVTPGGPYSSVAAALAANVPPGAWFRAADGSVKQAALKIRSLAIFGDSLVANSVNSQGTTVFPNFQANLLMYTGYAFDLTQNSLSVAGEVSFAAGGTPASELATRVDYMVNNVSPLPEAAFIHYGTNDSDNGVAPATIVGYLDAGIAKLQAAGVFPIVSTIVAGNDRSISGTPRSTRIAALNNAIVAAYADRKDLKLFDTRSLIEQSPGLAKEGWSVDGTHLGFSASKEWAKSVAGMMTANGYLPPRRSQHNGVRMINNNPWFASNTGGVRTYSNGTNQLVSRAARTDAGRYEGEFEAIINFDVGNPVIGTPGSNAVAYTKKGGVTEAYVHQWANPAGNAVLSCELRSNNTLQVNLVCAVGGGSITTTPAQVVSAVTAFASSPYTAVADGTNPCASTKAPYGEYWSAIEASTEPLMRGEECRVVVQVRPVPGYDFKLKDLIVTMQGNGGSEGATLSAIQNIQSQRLPEFYIPMSAHGELTFVSPWNTVRVANDTTNRVSNPWVALYYTGYGRFAISRLQIQKRLGGNPFYN